MAVFNLATPPSPLPLQNHLVIPSTNSKSDVKHRLPQIVVNRDIAILKSIVTAGLAFGRIKHPTVPAPAPLTCNVCVVNRRRDADGRCRSTEKKAHPVSYAVKVIGGVLVGFRQLFLPVLLPVRFEDFIQKDEVVCWAGSPGKGRV